MAFTGSNAQPIAWLAISMIVGGFLLFLATGKKRDADEIVDNAPYKSPTNPRGDDDHH